MKNENDRKAPLGSCQIPSIMCFKVPHQISPSYRWYYIQEKEDPHVVKNLQYRFNMNKVLHLHKSVS